MMKAIERITKTPRIIVTVVIDVLSAALLLPVSIVTVTGDEAG